MKLTTVKKSPTARLSTIRGSARKWLPAWLVASDNSAPTARPAASARRLHHPISTLIIGVAGFLLFAAIALVSNVFANSTTSWWTTAIFVGFALLALPILPDGTSHTPGDGKSCGRAESPAQSLPGRATGERVAGVLLGSRAASSILMKRHHFPSVKHFFRNQPT